MPGLVTVEVKETILPAQMVVLVGVITIVGAAFEDTVIVIAFEVII